MGNLISMLMGTMLSQIPVVVLNGAVKEYISTFSFQREGLEIGNLSEIRDLVELDTDKIERIRDIFQRLVLLGQELRVFFTVPNHQQIMMPNDVVTPSTPNPRILQDVVAFINFLLIIIEAIQYLESISSWSHQNLESEGPFLFIPNLSKELGFHLKYLPIELGFLMKNLGIELGFLISFLGDTAMHLQAHPTKSILIDIVAVVNEVGSFFFSFYFTLFIHMRIFPIEGMFEKPEIVLSLFANMETMIYEVGTFLHSIGDIQSQTIEVEEIKNAMGETEALVHELESFIFTKNAQVSENGIWYHAISNLLPMFEPLKTKIKEHCIMVSKMPSETPPRTALVSLFIVDSVCDDLRDLINNKADMIVGVDDQIEKLHEDLMNLGSSVIEIIEQQEAGHQQFLVQTRDVAYEVEYVINSLPHIWYLTLRLPQLIEKIQYIAIAVNERKKSGAAEMPEPTKYPNEHVLLQSTETYVLENNVVGIKEVKNEIAQQLVRGPDRLQIVSIIGMPGIGKTTLANILYKDPIVVHHFDKRSWCVVSQTYNKRNVLIEILSTMGMNKRETFKEMKDDELVENLYKSLKGRRYLIVLDDIWDTDVWNDLKRYLPDDGTGSRILFTTRNMEVGPIASSRGVRNELPFLSEAECWDLLQLKVFQDKNCPEELVEIGKRIAASCNGLPLAVVVIAGVLANMEEKQHLWQQVATNLSSHMHENPDSCNRILELSYRHLPMHLKPCFLYFRAFKGGMEIPVQRLLSLWAAEGFIKKEDDRSLDHTGLQCLMKLINRSLVLVAKRGSRGEVKTCKIHDLLLEMCSRIADENNFLKVINLNDDDSKLEFSQLLMHQQHLCLSIINGEPNDDDYFDPYYIPPFGLHMRSLQVSDLLNPILISSSWKVLRVLESPFVIGLEQLFYLRYLATTIALPSMENFHKLEFLFLDTSNATEIPEALLNMVSLRHVHFKGGAYFSKSCRQQATKGDSSQINNNLERISVLSVSDEIDEKILRYSPNLRKLKGKLGSSPSYSFDSFNKLESLKLSTSHRGSRLIRFPSNLKKLTLVHAHMSPEQMKIIERLQYLEVLKLEGTSFEGDQWDAIEGEFPQLKFLKLSEIQITEWNASSEHFPSLQHLVLQLCNNLELIPSSICDIPTLQKIEVIQCAEAVKDSAKQIQKELEEMGIEDIMVTITEGD